MDNPQHYQPLSHALHPPTSSASRAHYTTQGQHTGFAQQEGAEASRTRTHIRPHEEEEEEEEEEGEDEGLVEEQLNQTDTDIHTSRPSTPRGSTSGDPLSSNVVGAALTSQSITPIPEKRRPGRPRGSKNRKARISAKNESQFYAGQQQGNGSTATPTLAALPSHPNITPQNQPYYEFQWRMLNLCAEFYGAAEELVKATSPLVVAQCYHFGPGVKVDPLAMLGEAKGVCDTLLANPSQLVTNPPPPIYPVLPTVSMYQPAVQPPVAGPSTTLAPTSSSALPAAVHHPSGSATTTQPGIISASPSFVVPLQQPAVYPQYALYGSAPHAQYPTASYYHQYAPYPTPYYGHAHTQPSQPSSISGASVTTSAGAPAAALPTTSTTITTTPATGGTMIGNSGPWSEEESERLKKLAEDSRSRAGAGIAGEVDWDWVVSEWGPTRSRHQVLLQANKLNLKESTTRGTKRRREDGQADVTGTPSFQPSTSTSTTAVTTAAPSTGLATSSPVPGASHSAAATTPGASPALQNQQQPSSSTSGPSTSQTQTTTATPAPKLPWPMPTVAVSAPSVPVLSTPTSGASLTSSFAGHGQEQRTSHYRPRPANAADASQTVSQQHQQQNPYIYAANGHALRAGGHGAAVVYRPKKNGT